MNNEGGSESSYYYDAETFLSPTAITQLELEPDTKFQDMPLSTKNADRGDKFMEGKFTPNPIYLAGQISQDHSLGFFSFMQILPTEDPEVKLLTIKVLIDRNFFKSDNRDLMKNTIKYYNLLNKDPIFINRRDSNEKIPNFRLEIIIPETENISIGDPYTFLQDLGFKMRDPQRQLFEVTINGEIVKIPEE